NARRAAAMAASKSLRSPSAAFPMTSSVAGSMSSNVRPVLAPTSLPSISIRFSVTVTGSVVIAMAQVLLSGPGETDLESLDPAVYERSHAEPGAELGLRPYRLFTGGHLLQSLFEVGDRLADQL